MRAYTREFSCIDGVTSDVSEFACRTRCNVFVLCVKVGIHRHDLLKTPFPGTSDANSVGSEWGQEDHVEAAAVPSEDGLAESGVERGTFAGEEKGDGGDGGRRQGFSEWLNLEDESGRSPSAGEEVGEEVSENCRVQPDVASNIEDEQAEVEEEEEEPLDPRKLVVTIVTARDVPIRLRAPGRCAQRMHLELERTTPPLPHPPLCVLWRSFAYTKVCTSSDY